MKKIGFLGCGKIGQALLKHVKEEGYGEIVFIEDPYVELSGEPVIRKAEESAYEKAELIVECATADVLKEHIDIILKHADLLMFSVTAFSDAEFAQYADTLCRKYNRRIFLPHGAILGLDGIFDGRKVWKEVSIITTKSSKSLGREDKERTVVYEGPTREACRLYPRNVNVHAAIALAGIGFDKTHSKIISDPAVSTNAHTIQLKGDGINITMNIESFAAGAVTGAYTPHSACGSIDRICKETAGKMFV
ncbi:MAG: DUF108 domain-containing protein [Lachnospiraceae bacterium]|nr:DUF108 domain-containing protein [Lachnospiraceae bacterium]